MLDWDDLHSFLTIARHGTLSAAARALGVTQTTMGRRLEALQGRAGVKLLNRTPGGFVLTTAGERVLANVERMEAEALAVERAVTGEDARLEGEVRITTVEALAAHLLVPALGPLAARYPAITVEIDVDTRSLSLSRREADIAVRLAAFEQHDAIVRKVGTMLFGVYASPAYLADRGATKLAEGAPGHRVITLQENLLQTPEGRWFARVTDRASVALRTNSRDGQLAAAVAGLGLACLPRYLADPVADLVRVELGEQAPLRDIWLGVHRDTRWTPRIRAVLDHLGQIFADQQPRLAPDA